MSDTVIIVPGNLSSSLAANGRHLWINPLALAQGLFSDLALGPLANPEQNLNPAITITPIGLIPILYDFLQSALKQAGFNPVAFPFDWRVDIGQVAERLAMELATHQGAIHLIGHSEGCLVIRKALEKLSVNPKIGKIILLGPPNQGVFAAALGIAGNTTDIPLLNLFPGSSANIQSTVKTFTSLYQMLPWNDEVFTSLKSNYLYNASFWNGLADEERLGAAWPTGSVPWISTIDDRSFYPNMTIICGYNRNNNTCGGVKFINGKLVVDSQYNVAGDGVVPAISSALDGVNSITVDGVGHIQLPMSNQVINHIIGILES